MTLPKKPTSRKSARANRGIKMPTDPSATLFPIDVVKLQEFRSQRDAARPFSQSYLVEFHREYILKFATDFPIFSAADIAKFLKAAYQGEGTLTAEFQRAVIQLVNTEREGATPTRPKPSSAQRTTNVSNTENPALPPSTANAVAPTAPVTTAVSSQQSSTYPSPSYPKVPAASATAVAPAHPKATQGTTANVTTQSANNILSENPRVMRISDEIIKVTFVDKWYRESETLANNFYRNLYNGTPFKDTYRKLIDDDTARDTVVREGGERLKVLEIVVMAQS